MEPSRIAVGFCKNSEKFPHHKVLTKTDEALRLLVEWLFLLAALHKLGNIPELTQWGET